MTASLPTKAIWRPAMLIGGLVAAGLALHELPPGGASSVLTSFAAQPGVRGLALFVSVGAVLCAIGVPRQIVAYVGAYAFGFWIGAAVALMAQLVGCVADFYWARAIGRAWAARNIQRFWKGRLARIDRFLAANPFAATLTMRLLPVGSNIAFNLLAGVSAVALPPFVAGSALGYIPQTAIFALLGGGARVERATQIEIGVALFAISAGIGMLLLRRFRSLAAE